jgi:hypothetical protein
MAGFLSRALPGPLRHHGAFADLVAARVTWVSQSRPRKGEEADAFFNQLDAFEVQHGAIQDAYWCENSQSAAALTIKTPRRRWFRRPEIRLHRETDWKSAAIRDVAHLLHESDVLTVRVSSILRGTSSLIALSSLLNSHTYLLGFTDWSEGKRDRARDADSSEKRRIQSDIQRNSLETAQAARVELDAIDAYYQDAGLRAARLVYFQGMVAGILILGALAAVIWFILYTSIPGVWGENKRTLAEMAVCVGMGAIGALASVMSRTSSNETSAAEFDYELGRRPLWFLGAFRPVVGAIFALVLYFAFRGDLLPFDISVATPAGVVSVYAVISFLAGFSERWATLAVSGVASSLEITPVDNRSASSIGTSDERVSGKTRPSRGKKPAVGA